MARLGRLVNTIPSHDGILRRVVDRIARDLTPPTPSQLAARLRPLYPKVAVFERQLSGEPKQVYVYRDGRFEPDVGDDWWRAPDVPQVRIRQSSGLLTSANPSFAQLLGVPSSSLVGRTFLDLVRHDAQPAATAMLEALGEEDEARSEVAMVHVDGATLLLELRAIKRDGEVDLWFRPAPLAGQE